MLASLLAVLRKNQPIFIKFGVKVAREATEETTRVDGNLDQITLVSK